MAQLPALILSLATAIIVTRVTTSESTPDQASKQLANPLAFYIAGGILTVMGLVPGMPNMIFLMLGGIALGLGYYLHRSFRGLSYQAPPPADMQLDSPDQPEDPNLLELGWDDAGQVDVISLELGYGLIPMVDADTGGRLLNRLKGIRKKLSAEMGFLLPSIRIRDNLDSAPDAYQIVINGSVRGVGVIANGKEMAINPGNVLSEIPGEPGKDPAFGLDAVWIDPSEREYAQAVGYTVVDASTVIATHLNSVIKDNADELMTYDVAQQLIDKIAETSPKLVEDFIPEKLTLGTVVRVLQNLLRERVPLRDMRTILETLSEESSRTQDAGQLCALVRPKLARLIVQDIIDPDETLAVMTLDPTLEQLLTDLVSRANSYDEIALEPALAESFFASIRSTIEELEQQDLPAVLVVSPMLRPWLARLLRRSTKDLTVLCYTEIPDDQPISVVSSIEVNEREDEQS